MFKRVRIVGLVLLAVLCAGPALAQTSRSSRPPRIYRGLFGPTERDDTRPERLNFTFSLYGAVDDNSRFATDSDVLDATLQSRRMYEGAQSAMSFRRARPKSLITVDGLAALRYYPDLRQITTAKYSGAVNLELTPARDWKIQASNGTSYSPYYQIVPGQSIAAGADTAAASADYSVSRDKQMVYGSFASVTYTPTRAASVVAHYGVRYIDFFNVAAADLDARSAGARFAYQFARDVGVHLGYSRGSESWTSSAAPFLTHNLDVGLDYRKALAFSQRTSFAVSSGSTIVTTDEGRHFQVTGSARVNHQFSPRWAGAIAFERGLQVLATAPRPFFASTVTGSVGGFVNNRVSFRWSPIYAQGIDVTRDTTYHSLSSQARVEVAVDRHWAAYVEHFYYTYRFSADPALPSVLTAGLDRNGVRAGLTLWTPVLR